MRKIVAVVVKRPLKSYDEKQEDLDYWLSRPPQERIAAVTQLVRSTIPKDLRMDRTAVSMRLMRESC